MSAFIRLRLHILALLALAAAIAGQFGSLFWLAELLSHFLPHYAAVFILAAIWPRPKWRVLWLVCTAASLLWLAQPFTLPDAPAGGTRLVWYNVHLDNPAAKAESTALLAEQADFIALGEINLDNPGWQSLRQAYPHGCQRREYSPFALALWSKQPLTKEYRSEIIREWAEVAMIDGEENYDLNDQATWADHIDWFLLERNEESLPLDIPMPTWGECVAAIAAN